MTGPINHANGYLGSRSAVGEIGPTNLFVAGCWVVTFTAQDLAYPGDAEIYHMALRGPGGGFLVYIDDTFYSTSDRGDLNEYDPKHPMFVRRGQGVTFHWNVSVDPAPQVWLFAKEPGVRL